MASIKTLLAIIPFIAIGVWTYQHLMAAVNPFMAPIVEACPGQVAESPILGFVPVDSMLCFLTAFFEACVRHPSSVIINGYLFSTAYNVVLFMFVEASRKGAPFVLTLMPLYTLLLNLVAISVIIPLLWIPFYFLFNARYRPAASQTEGKAVPIPRTVAIGIFVFGCLPLPLSLFILTGEALRWPIVWLLVTGILQPLPMYPFYGTVKNQKACHSAVELLYMLGAGLALLWHMIAIVLAYSNISYITGIVDVFYNHEGPVSTSYFLLIDAIVLYGSILAQVLVEDGILAFLSVTLLSIPIGPAAVPFYYVWRERQLASLVGVAKSVKKTQ